MKYFRYVVFVFMLFFSVLAMLWASEDSESKVSPVLTNSVQLKNAVNLPDWIKNDSHVNNDVEVSFGVGRVWISIGFLLFVFLIGLLCYRWAVKRGAGGNVLGIRLLSRFYLSPKISLVVIEVDGERFLLGVGENVNVLARLTGQGFRQMVVEESGAVNKNHHDRELSEQQVADFIKGLSERVSELKQAIRKYKGEL